MGRGFFGRVARQAFAIAIYTGSFVLMDVAYGHRLRSGVVPFWLRIGASVGFVVATRLSSDGGRPRWPRCLQCRRRFWPWRRGIVVYEERFCSTRCATEYIPF